jgi:hypothetical protein
LGQQWISIIDQHVNRAKAGDFKLFNKVDKYVLGDPWAETTVGASEAELIKTSTNFARPILETAASLLVPPNPQVSAQPRNPLNEDQILGVDGVVNHSLDVGRWRDELTVVVENAVKYGRGPTKTTWDGDSDLPVTRFLDPRNYFYDQTAQRFEDVRYEIEATLLSKRDMEKRIAEEMYPPTALERQNAERYPTWLLPDGRAELNDLKNYQPWYLVWEVHDRESGKVKHFLPEDNDPILDDDLIFRPYDLLTFSYNGKDIGGVSEIGLILANQEEYNWTETFLLNILRFSIPGIFYDNRATTTDKMVKVQNAPLGAAMPLNINNEIDGGIANVFFQRPFPQQPPLAQEMLARKREGMMFVSALSDAQRGQTVGAKTATEMEFIKSQIRDRLGPRIGKVDGLTERVAEKHLFLASRFMQKEKVLQLTGSKVWTPISPWTIEGVSAAFKMVPYSPMMQNKALRVETLRNIQPLLAGNPNIDQRKLAEALLETADLPSNLLLSEEKVAAAAQAMLGGPQPPGPVALPNPEPVPGEDVTPVGPAPAEAA